VRAEVWMALIHGSKGLIYFVHQFKPFNEHALLDDPALLADGGLDALLRTSDEACGGLHIDRIVVRGGDSSRTPAILVTRPGIAGCRQHRNLVKLLRA